MKLNRNEYNCFIQQLDRTAEKNPLLWLPCILLITLALAGEYIAEYVQIVYSHRNTEKAVKEKPQLERKPFALRAVAMSLVVALSFMFMPELSVIVFADDFGFPLDDILYSEQFGTYSSTSNDYYLIYNSKLKDILAANSGIAFDLFDLDSNGVPELFVSLGSAHVAGVEIYSVNENMLVELKDENGNSTFGGWGEVFVYDNYLESVFTAQGSTNTDIFKKNGESLQTVLNAYNEDGTFTSDGLPIYKINGIEVSEDEYKAALNPYNGYVREKVGPKFRLDEETIDSVLPPFVVTNNADFDYSVKEGEATINKYKGISTDVIIPETIDEYPVRYIGSESFSHNSYVRSVTLPQGIKNINEYAFCHCPTLESITVPERCEWSTYADYKAFCTCPLLTVYGYGGPIEYISGMIDEERFMFKYALIGQSNKCGNNAFWTLSDDGTLTISGTGKMWDYAHYVDNSSWASLSVKNVVIEEGITYLGKDSFYDIDIESITFPSTLEEISDSALYYVRNLKNINFADGLKKIGHSNFYGIISNSITIPESVKEIGSYSFNFMDDNKNVFIYSKDAVIGNNAFRTKSMFDDLAPFENLTIYGYLDSTAETYARENNINFKPLMEFEPNPAILDHEPYKVIYLKSEDLTLTNIDFYCADTSVATVDHFSYDEANGNGTVMVKAVALGTTDLICTSNGQEVGRCTVNVKQVTSGTVAFVPDNTTVSIGKTVEITADVMNDYMEKANFVIDNTSIAEIVSTNKELDSQDEIDVYNIVIKGLQAGTTYLTLYEDDNIVGRCPITVTSSGVIFDPENVTVNKDNAVEINAKVINGNMQISEFKIDDNDIAEILNTSSNLDTNECTFTVKGLNEGSTYLSFWEDNVLVGRCAIHVTVKGQRDPLIKAPEYLYPQSGSRSFYVHALKEVDGYLEPIENATVKVNVINPLNPDYNRNIGGMTDSNGICTIENVNGVDYHVTVSAEGYNSRTIPVNFKDGGRNSHSQVNNLAYINYGKGFSVILTPVSSKPDIVSAVFNDNSGDSDILMHDKTIFIDNENTESCSFKVSVQLYDASRATVSLIQKGNVIATRSAPADDNGIVDVEFRDTWKSKLERYEDVNIEVESNRGQSKTVKTRLIVNNQLFKSNKDVEKFELSWNKGNGSVQIPSNVVGFGGMNVSLDLPSIPADFVVSEDNGTVFLSFGMGSFDSKRETKDKYIERISGEWDKTLKNYDTMRAFSDGQTVKGMISDKVGGDFKFKGCGKGKIGNNGTVVIDVQFLMSYKFSAEYPQQYIIGVVPVYLNVGMNASASYKPGIKINFNITDFGNTINVKPIWGTLTMEIGASLHGGVGIAKVLSVGGSIDGTLSLTTEFATLHQMLKVRAGAYLEAQALIFKWTMPITEQTWTLYDNKNRSSYMSQQDALTSSEVYNGTFTELPRNYNTESFSNRSAFFNSAPESITYNSDDSQEIGSNVYPDAQSKIVTVNGTQYLFRLADDGSRTSLNRTVLVCSAKNGDSWGTPFIINDDGTGDYYFDICVDNNDIYIAWTNCSKSFEDDAAIEDVTATTNITVAVLNTLTGKVEKIGTTGRTSLGDYFPVIYVKDGAGIVAWLSNSDNNIMQTSGTNSINYSMINNNTISKYSEYFSTQNLIVSVDTGIIGENYAIAFSCDTDGNEATIDDTEIYASVFDEDPIKITDNSFVDGQVKFAESNGKGYLFWYENGDMAYTNSLNSTYSKAFNNIELTTDEFAISEDNGSIRFIWVERKNIENLAKSCVVVSEFSNSFSEPSICDITDGELSDIAAYCNTDGTVSYVASTKRADGVNIYDTKEREIKDIEFKGIYVDYGKAYSGEKMPIILNIVNNGNVDIDELTLIVKSENGTESITLYDMNLKAQTNGDFTFYITVPSLSEKTSISISSDTYHKSIDFELGYTDLAISVNKFYEGNNSYADVCITNESEIPSAAKLSIYVDGEQRFIYEIESISPYGMAALVFDVDQISDEYEEIKFEVSPYKDEVYTYNNASSLHGTKTRAETTYTVSIPNNVTVYRNNSLLTDKAIIYSGDVLTIIADIPNGFNLRSITVNNVSITNGGTYIVENEDVIISVEYEHSHSLDVSYSSDVGGHWRTCSNCNEKVGYEAHSEDNGTVTIEATETTDGLMTYKCSVCDYVTRTKKIPAGHKHSFNLTWKSNADYHWHECTICGEPADTEQHNENNVVDSVKPTATTAGTRTYSCSVCGYTVRTENIPPIDPNLPYPTYPMYPTVTTTSASNEPYIYGDTSKSGWDTIISEIDFAADGSTIKVNMNGAYELPKNVVSRIQNRNINLELHCGGAVWTINGLDVTNPKTVNMRVSDRYNKIPASVIDSLNSELKAIELRLYHSGDFGFKATLTFGVGKKYNNYYGALYHYNTKTKQLEFVDESLALNRQITFELTHASYYAIAFNSVPIYDDISSGAGVTADSIPIDFAIPTSDGVTIPAIKLPQIMKYSSKKRRYRILKKRKLDDLVFVL